MRLTLRDLPRKRAALLIVLLATDLENISAEKEVMVLASPSFCMIRGKQLELQITLLTEQENTNMLAMLKQLAAKVGANVSPAPTLAVWEQATHPER